MSFSCVFFDRRHLETYTPLSKKRGGIHFFKNKKINVFFSGDILYLGELKDLKVLLMLSES